MSKITYDGVEVTLHEAIALHHWDVGKVKSAHTLIATITFCRSLERKGFLKDVTPPTDKDVRDPRTHYQFERINLISDIDITE